MLVKYFSSFRRNSLGFVGILYQVEEVPSIPSLLRVFIMNECWILPNAFSEFVDMIKSLFFFWPDIMDYVNQFSSVELVLHIWEKLHLVAVCNSLYILLDLIANIL